MVAHDIEVRAAQLRGLEARAASRRGRKAANGGRPRRVRAVMFERAGRLVAVTAAPTIDDGTADQAGRWIAAVREAVEDFPPDYPSPEWISLLWSGAVRRLAESPGTDLGQVATAILAAESAPGGAVDYELAVAGPMAASLFGAGIHQDLETMRTPDTVLGTGPGETPCRIHVDRLGADQALLLTSGVDPARFAQLQERPGPLGTAWVLESERAEADQLALVLWGER
jgi:hypothetical protein